MMFCFNLQAEVLKLTQSPSLVQIHIVHGSHLYEDPDDGYGDDNNDTDGDDDNDFGYEITWAFSLQTEHIMPAHDIC